MVWARRGPSFFLFSARKQSNGGGVQYVRLWLGYEMPGLIDVRSSGAATIDNRRSFACIDMDTV